MEKIVTFTKTSSMFDIFSVFVQQDAYDSILYAVLGGLFLLSSFHLMMFILNRDKSYLLYSFYTFFALLAYIPMVESGFLRRISNFYGLDICSKQFFTIIYNCLYFLFFTQFLKIRSTNKLWNNIIVFPALILMGIGTITFLLLQITGIEIYFSTFYKLFVFFITTHFLLSFYLLSKLENQLKYYILFGGILLFVCSMIGSKVIRELPFINISVKMGDFIYYIGLFLENIAFSFALGHQQRAIYHERKIIKLNFFKELKKNIALKIAIDRKGEEIENERLLNLQQISDLKLTVLQTQMNPHFVFNALNSIKYYINENEPAIAVDYLNKFSKVIRTILIASTMREFTLEQEVQTLKMYVDIENLRFNNELSFTIVIDPNINSEKITLPPLVLQPFVENAIIHGIADVPDKQIELKIWQNGSKIEISITDNGIGRKKAAQQSAKGKSMGTKIAQEMLTNYFGENKFQLSYDDLHTEVKPSGTRLNLVIPAL